MGEPIGLQLAKRYASWGWKVIPAMINKDGMKIPLIKDWPRKATTTCATLEEWWTARPYSHPGFVSGTGSCLVIDVDGAEAVAWVDSLAAQYGYGNVLVYNTPGRSGGRHIVGTWPEWLDEDFRQGKVIGSGGSEVQVRGNGHFTMSLGAKRRDGEYSLIQEPVGMPGEITRELVEEILQWATVGVGGIGSDLRSVSPEDAYAMGELQDGRKAVLAGLCWYLGVRGHSEEEIYAVCADWNRTVCVPPLPDSLVVTKTRYAFERATEYRQRNEKEVQKLRSIYDRFK